MASFEVEGRVTLDTDEAVSALQDLQQKLADLAGQEADPTVTADTEEASNDLDELLDKLESLDGATADPTVTADTAEADAKLDEVRTFVVGLDGTTVEIQVDADTSEADAKMAAMRSASWQDRIGGGGAPPGGLGNVTEGGEEDAEEDTEKEVSSGGGSEDESSAAVSMLASHLKQLAITGPAAATAIAGAFTALPGILSGVSGAVGGLVAGFMGISQAIQAYIAVEDTANQTALQMQSIQISSAQSLQNAAAQVVSAETSLAQAQVQSYDSVYNAQEQLVMSEQQLEAAQYGQRASQLALTEATMQAKFQLQDYQQQIAGMALQLQQAQVNVEETRLALAETLGDPAATQIQRQQAQVAYEQALQQVKSLTVQQSQLQQEYALASSLGVKGSQQVQAAQQGVVQSQFQMKDSVKGVATSQMMLSQAQVQAQQQMMMATQQLTLALSAQKATAQQVAITMQQPIGAYAQLDQAMAALGPAGQQFVQWFMTSFYPVLKQLEYGAEGALLPGIEKALTTMGPYFQAMGKVFDQFDTAFSAMLGRWAQFLSSKQGISEFNAAMKSGLGFMNDVGNAILTIMQAFGTLGKVGSPIVAGIGSTIKLVANLFKQWAESGGMKLLVTALEGVGKGIDQVFKVIAGPQGEKVIIAMVNYFGQFLQVLAELLPVVMPVIRIVYQLQAALAPLIEAILKPLIPVLRTVIDALGHGLLTAVAALIPPLMPLIDLLTKLALSILIPLTPLITLVAKTLAQVLGPAVHVLTFLLTPLINGLTQIFNAIGVLINYVVRTGPLLGHLGGIFSGLGHVIMGVVGPAFNWLKTAFGDIMTVAQPFFNLISNGLNTGLSALANIFQRLAGLVGGFARGIGSVFKTIGSVGGSIGSAIAHLFADGGFVDKPTLGIVGEAGPEVVIPLNNKSRALELMSMVASQTALPMGGGMGAMGGASGAQTVINVQALSSADPMQIAQEIAWAMKSYGSQGVA